MTYVVVVVDNWSSVYDGAQLREFHRRNSCKYDVEFIGIGCDSRYFEPKIGGVKTGLNIIVGSGIRGFKMFLEGASEAFPPLVTSVQLFKLIFRNGKI